MNSKHPISVSLRYVLNKIARADLRTLMVMTTLAVVGLAVYALYVIYKVVTTLLAHVQFA